MDENKEMNRQNGAPERVVVVGGQAAGCKTAARLARLLPDCEITVIERNKIVSFGACGLPFYASGEVDDLLDLARTPWGVVRDATYFRDAKGIEVLTEMEVVDIDPQQRRVGCEDLRHHRRVTLSYDALVLATGARPLEPTFPSHRGERVSHFHRPEDARKFRRFAQTGRIHSVAILGGGFIGVELAEPMVSLWGIDTVLLEQQERLLPKMLDPALANHLSAVMRKNGIVNFLGSSVKRIGCNEEGMPRIDLEQGHTISPDYVFVCLGLEPETRLAQRIGADLGRNGGILVDEEMRTSVPGVWAVGDCVEVKNLITEGWDWFPMGSLANREGRVAADSISGQSSRFPGAVGTASLKLFGLTLGSTGLTATRASQLGMSHRTLLASFLDRPDYHPEKSNLFMEVIYEPETLRILGLQAAGSGEVTRYVDVISAILPGRCTAFDLLDLEHAYTPPHASPVSPLHHLGALILAHEREGITGSTPQAGEFPAGIVLDVRTDEEQKSMPLPMESVHIPQERLRQRCTELDRSNPIHVICRRGPRSYEAVRFLKTRGLEEVDYIEGGTAMWFLEEEDE